MIKRIAFTLAFLAAPIAAQEQSDAGQSYDSQLVVIETTMGDITVSIETERAPITGGTQMEPERVLAPIAHEPTSSTGLSHTDGALSMARYDPGTATGDFSIMIKDQTGLDANPASSDPNLQLGFAVFGYVVDGMEVVHAIHAAPIDPDKGEGWMKGQLLAEPVEIIDMRRVEAASAPEG